MPLNIGSGNTKPFAKYNSKSDKWFAPGDQEIDRPTFVVDFPNIAIGWMLYRECQAPERRIFPTLDCEVSKPNEDFKKGFVLTLFSEKFFGGGVEFSSTSLHVRNAVSELYNVWEQERDQHPDELPVVACVGSEKVTSRYGTNYKPKFQIQKWTRRPPGLPDQSSVDASEIASPIGEAAKPRPALAMPPRPASLQTEF